MDGKPMELDLVAESTDQSVLLVGEVKWSNKISPDEINASLSQKCLNLPFTKSKRVIKAVFSKVTPAIFNPDVLLFVPDDIVSVLPD